MEDEGADADAVAMSIDISSAAPGGSMHHDSHGSLVPWRHAIIQNDIDQSIKVDLIYISMTELFTCSIELTKVESCPSLTPFHANAIAKIKQVSLE